MAESILKYALFKEVLKPSKRKRRKLNRGIAVEEGDVHSETDSDSEQDIKRMEGEPSEIIRKTRSKSEPSAPDSEPMEIVVESQGDEIQLAPERCARFTHYPASAQVLFVGYNSSGRGWRNCSHHGSQKTKQSQ